MTGESTPKSQTQGQAKGGQVNSIGMTVSVVACGVGATVVYGEDLSTLDRLNTVFDMIESLRAEASNLCGQMMGELSGVEEAKTAAA